ncbi:hypothetical protein Tco_1121948, partial [Tanacetum coccineum]
IPIHRTGKYGDFDGHTSDDLILILEILSMRFFLKRIYLITGSSKDGDGDTSFQWSQFTTQCSHLMLPNLLTKGFDAGRHVKRGRDTKIPQSSGPPVKVGDEAVHKELGDRMERATTTASSFEVEYDSSGPRCQDTILGDVDAQTRIERYYEQSTKIDNSTASEAITTADVEDSAVLQYPPQIHVSLTNITVTQPSIKDKGKGIMQEPERPLTKKVQVALDEDLVRNIQAQLDAEIFEEERLERQKQEEANIALIESWENTQAMMEANRLLAERLQTREREELTDEEKGKLFMELIEKKRKHFAAIRAQEKRNRPLTKAQQRSQIFTYLKHMEAQESNEKKVEGSEDKAKSSRKTSLETDKHEEVGVDDTTELKKHLLIKKDDEIPNHQMLQGIDREDLETLWKLFKTKHGDLRPEDEHERVLWGDLKVMFEPDIRSEVLIALTLYRIINAKLTLKLLKPTKMSLRLADRSFQYPVGIAENMLIEVGKFTFPVDFIILAMEEDSKKGFNALLDEEPPFKKITINTDYKIKTSLEEPPMDLELKPLLDNLEYVFLEELFFLPVIISSQLSKEKKNKLLSVLKKHKEAFA